MAVYPALRVPPFEVWHMTHRATYARAVHALLKGAISDVELGRVMRVCIHANPSKVVRVMAHWFTVDPRLRADPLEGSDYRPERRVTVKVRS